MTLSKKMLFTALIALMLIVTVLPLASAASDKYETIKPNVPIWSAARSSSTKLRTISSEGTVLTVVDSKVNIYLNNWYKLNDGSWVYSKNVAPHKCVYDQSGDRCKCGAAAYWRVSLTDKLLDVSYKTSEKSNAPLWTKPTSTLGSKVMKRLYNGDFVHAVEVWKNHYGSTFYKTDEGFFIYSKNVVEHTHKYDSQGKCICGKLAYWKDSNTDQLYDVSYKTSEKSYVPLWTKPTSTLDSKVMKRLYNGDLVHAVEVWKNHYGSTFFKTDEGFFIYSKNVSDHVHKFGAQGKCICGLQEYSKSTDTNVYQSTDGTCTTVTDTRYDDSFVKTTDGKTLPKSDLTKSFLQVITDYYGGEKYTASTYSCVGDFTIVPHPAMKLLNQCDYPNVYIARGKTIASSGCGYTSLAMVVNTLKGKSLSPYDIFALNEKSYAYDSGMEQDNIIKVAKMFSLTVKPLALCHYKRFLSGVPSKIYASLRKGDLLICKAMGNEKRAMSQQMFVSERGGHYIVVGGYRRVNEKEQVLVYDPNGVNYTNSKRLSLWPQHPSGARWIDIEYILTDCVSVYALNVK